MKPIILFLIITITLVAVMFFLIYIFGDAAEEDKVGNERNVFIRAYNPFNNNFIATNVSIYCNHTLMKIITTGKYGYQNFSLSFCDGMVDFVNDANDGYYTDFNTYLGNSFKSVDLELYNIGKLEVKQLQSLSNEYNETSLLFSTDSQFRNLIICPTWSINLLDVKIKDNDGSEFNKILEPVRLKDKVMKCYDTIHSIEKGDIYFTKVEYEKIYSLTSDDYIILYLLDKNKIAISELPYKEFIIEDENGRDVGAMDIIIQLR